MTDPGTLADPVINMIDGDATLTAVNDFPGAGILQVTGDLIIYGYPDFDGLIYVIGTGSMRIFGGGTGDINGGVFIANTTTCPAALGSPTFDT